MAETVTTAAPLSTSWSSSPLVSKMTSTDGKTYYFKDSEARNKINAIIPVLKAGIELVVVSTLPTAAESTMGKIYLVPIAAGDGATETNNVKREYITVKGGTEASPTYSWEELGDTRVNLSDYVKKGHTHSVTVGSHNHTWAQTAGTIATGATAAAQSWGGSVAGTVSGTNAASNVTFVTTGNTADAITALGAPTVAITGTNTTSGVTGSATVAGTNAASDVTFNTTNNTANAITALGAGSVDAPKYKLGASTTKYLTATASGTDVNTVTKFVASSATGGGSVTGGSLPTFGATVDANETLSFTFTQGSLQTITMPSFTQQTIATGIKTQPTIALTANTTAVTGAVTYVESSGTLAADGTTNCAVSFGAHTTASVLKSSVTATAKAQTWAQTSGSISGTAAAQTWSQATGSVTFADHTTATVLKSSVTATAAAQAWKQSSSALTVSGTNAASAVSGSVTVTGTNAASAVSGSVTVTGTNAAVASISGTASKSTDYTTA